MNEYIYMYKKIVQKYNTIILVSVTSVISQKKKLFVHV